MNATINSNGKISGVFAGDTRGSHHMPLMPVAINTPLAGAYRLPLVSPCAYLVTKRCKLSGRVDMFGNVAWGDTRLLAQRKAMEIRQQGFVGAAMLPMQKLEYSATRDSLAALEEQFQLGECRVPEPARDYPPGTVGTGLTR